MTTITNTDDATQAGRGHQAVSLRRLAALALCGAALAASTGCAMLDGITRSMIEAGVLKPSAARSAGLTGIEAEAVVEVRANGDRGVGVAVEDGMILTSAHVVGAASEVTLLRHSMVAGGVAARERAHVVWTDARHDLCLLSPVVPAESGRSASPRSGDAWLITLQGTGSSVSGTRSRGAVVRPVTLHPGDRMEINGGGLVHGDSGSPIVQDGRVVGVVRTASRFARVDPAVAVMRRLAEDRERIVAQSDGIVVSRY